MTREVFSITFMNPYCCDLFNRMVKVYHPSHVKEKKSKKGLKAILDKIKKSKGKKEDEEEDG